MTDGHSNLVTSCRALGPSPGACESAHSPDMKEKREIVACYLGDWSLLRSSPVPDLDRHCVRGSGQGPGLPVEVDSAHRRRRRERERGGARGLAYQHSACRWGMRVVSSWKEDMMLILCWKGESSKGKRAHLRRCAGLASSARGEVGKFHKPVE